MPSREILDRLFTVEKEAQGLVDAARTEADRRIAAAELAADSAFQKIHGERLAGLELRRTERRRAVDEEFAAALRDYRAALEAAAEDPAAFAALFDEFAAREA